MREYSKWHVKWKAWLEIIVLVVGSDAVEHFLEFGICEQDTIDSIVHLLSNKVYRWYIFMETRLLGQYLFPGAAT